MARVVRLLLLLVWPDDVGLHALNDEKGALVRAFLALVDVHALPGLMDM